MPSKWLAEQAGALAIDLDQEMLSQLADYCSLLQEWNKAINLTTITETAAIYELHFLDSLSVNLVVPMHKIEQAIDIGAGGGFPGLVLAIAFPQARFTLVESISKKTTFLRKVVAELGLSEQVQIIAERAEILGQQSAYREQYDLVVARAVARLAVLGEYCLPFAKLGGCFVAQKGPDVQAEIEEAVQSLQLLGGKVVQSRPWTLPGQAERYLIRIDKIETTPAQYPRRVGVPAKRPLL